MDTVALVPQDLADLIPMFLENRREELEELRSALREAHFARLQHVGERMFALGNPYGFRQITTFGRQIREACSAQDDATIGEIIEQYRAYLAKVAITSVPAPVERVRWNERPLANPGSVERLSARDGDAPPFRR